MIKILPTDRSDYQFAYRLMRENMSAYLDVHQIPWDQEWVEENYRDKENYSIFLDGVWVGFLSIEWLETSLFVHTLQLLNSVQGRTIGCRVLDFLLQQAADKNVLRIKCRSFADNPVLALYKRLGFKVAKEEGVLLELQLDIEGLKNDRVNQSGDYWRAHISKLRC